MRMNAFLISARLCVDQTTLSQVRVSPIVLSATPAVHISVRMNLEIFCMGIDDTLGILWIIRFFFYLCIIIFQRTTAITPNAF